MVQSSARSIDGETPIGVVKRDTEGWALAAGRLYAELEAGTKKSLN